MSLIITRGLGQAGVILNMPITLDVDDNSLSVLVSRSDLTIEINDETIVIDIGE